MKSIEGREERGGELLHLQSQLPDAHNRNWARPKPGEWNSVRVSNMDDRDWNMWVTTTAPQCVQCRGLEWDVRPGLKCRHSGIGKACPNGDLNRTKCIPLSILSHWLQTIDTRGKLKEHKFCLYHSTPKSSLNILYVVFIYKILLGRWH